MSQFESRLLAEGVRTIEGASPELLTYTNQSSEKSFEGLVLDRANQQDPQLQVSPLFSHFKKLTKNTMSQRRNKNSNGHFHARSRNEPTKRIGNNCGG